MSESQNSEKPAKDRRRHRREPCVWRASVLLEEKEVQCTVLDVSPGGAMIRVERCLPEYSEITLRMTRNGSFTGEVAWRQAGTAGLRFTHHPFA